MSASKITAVIGSIIAALVFFVYLLFIQYEMVDYLAMLFSLISIIISIAGIQDLFHNKQHGLLSITGTMIVYLLYSIILTGGGLLVVTLFRFAGMFYLTASLIISGCLVIYIILLKYISIQHQLKNQSILSAIDFMDKSFIIFEQIQASEKCKPYQKQLEHCQDMLQVCDPTRCKDIYEFVHKELKILKLILSKEETEKEEIIQSLISIEHQIEEAYIISKKGKSGAI